MRPDTLFTIFSYGILLPWGLLAFAPRWSLTQKIVHSAVIPLVLAVFYVAFIATDRAGVRGDFSFDGIMRLFASPQTFLAGWIHYLIGDLFLGAWEVRDAQRLGISHWVVVPSLFLTLMFAPVGLASWLLLRWALRKRVTLVEA